jgi:hypothetical protein
MKASNQPYSQSFAGSTKSLGIGVGGGDIFPGVPSINCHGWSGCSASPPLNWGSVLAYNSAVALR